jgi:hypothetical protein
MRLVLYLPLEAFNRKVREGSAKNAKKSVSLSGIS